MHQHPVTFKKLTLKELLSTPIFDNETKQSYISSLELDQHLDKPLHSVSGGESKRVECLLTLALHPRLLLLDEPDSGTDIHSTALIGKLLSDYQYRTGASILYVTHSKNISTWIKPSSSINLNSYYE